MGDGWKKAHVEYFRKGRDLAVRDASEPRLLQRREVMKTQYQVEPDEGKSCLVGDVLRAFATDQEGLVVVVRGIEKIGVINGEGGKVLRQSLLDPCGPGICELQITSTSEISGEARAELLEISDE